MDKRVFLLSTCGGNSIPERQYLQARNSGLKGPYLLSNFAFPIYVVTNGGKVQISFPRSRKKRMQKKWRKEDKNWAYKPTWGECLIPVTSYLKVTDPKILPGACPECPAVIMQEQLLRTLQQVVEQRKARSAFLSLPNV